MEIIIRLKAKNDIIRDEGCRGPARLKPGQVRGPEIEVTPAEYRRWVRAKDNA